MIIINFKNYVHGEKALKLALLVEKYLPKAVLAVSVVDIFNIAESTKMKVYAQAVNLGFDERATGYLTIEAINQSGASGTLLNHSEHQIGLDAVNDLTGSLKKAKLDAVVCASTLEFVGELLKLKNKPYAIAFEDPELIASGKSVTTYKPDELKRFVKLLEGKGILPVCGAGISTLEDVVTSRELGCRGVLISSAIANSKNPEKLLKSLQGIKY